MAFMKLGFKHFPDHFVLHTCQATSQRQGYTIKQKSYCLGQ